MTLLSGEALRPRRNWQAIITVVVVLAVGFLVILPMVFLVEESLNTGDPLAFPPVEFGIGNYFAIFEEDTPLKLIEQIKPSVLVKGGDYTREQVVGHEIVEAHGGEVVLVEVLAGFSTTSLVDRARGSKV